MLDRCRCMKTHSAARRRSREMLHGRMKTVWLETDERGEIVWHSVFLDFARYWGFTPRLVLTKLPAPDQRQSRIRAVSFSVPQP